MYYFHTKDFVKWWARTLNAFNIVIAHLWSHKSKNFKWRVVCFSDYLKSNLSFRNGVQNITISNDRSLGVLNHAVGFTDWSSAFVTRKILSTIKWVKNPKEMMLIDNVKQRNETVSLNCKIMSYVMDDNWLSNVSEGFEIVVSQIQPSSISIRIAGSKWNYWQCTKKRYLKLLRF